MHDADAQDCCDGLHREVERSSGSHEPEQVHANAHHVHGHHHSDDVAVRTAAAVIVRETVVGDVSEG